jgi:hypothetical protein
VAYNSAIFPDRRCHPGNLLDPGRGIGLDHRFHGLIIFGALGDVSVGLPAVFDDDVHHAVQQGHIAAQPMGDGHIGEAGQLNVSRIRHDEFGAAFLGPENTPGDQRVAGGGIGSDDKNAP